MTITEHLKNATNQLHRDTEACLPTKAMLDGSMNRELYAQLIATQFQIFQNLEKYLSVQLPKYPFLYKFYEPKKAWLQEDLSAMKTICPSPIGTGHPKEDEAFLTGMLYVIEGSMLGGQFILKGLSKNKALVNLPHRFYQGYGTDTGKKWKEFKILADKVVDPDKLDQAIRGAIYTFRFFQETFKNSQLLERQSVFQ